MTDELPQRREGYPVVQADHPLWSAQQAGWPDHQPPEAWSAAAAERPTRQFADSRSHPGFDPGYIVNQEATRPDEEARAADAEQVSKQERR